MTRGYFGIGIFQPKRAANIGTLWRSAHALGASFIFTIGPRYQKQASDTTDAQKHVPLFEYESLAEFEQNVPKGCRIVCIEQTLRSQNLPDFHHFERTAYILGAEDNGLPLTFCQRHSTVEIPSTYCLNVAVAGSIVLYDRMAKAMTRQPSTISGYWLDNVAVTDPPSPFCRGCGRPDELPCICPPDDAVYLRAWRDGAFDDDLEGYSEAGFYTQFERLVSGE